MMKIEMDHPWLVREQHFAGALGCAQLISLGQNAPGNFEAKPGQTAHDDQARRCYRPNLLPTEIC